MNNVMTIVERRKLEEDFVLRALAHYTESLMGDIWNEGHDYELYRVLLNDFHQALVTKREINQKREALKTAFDFTDERLDAMTEGLIDHYYDILRYGD